MFHVKQKRVAFRCSAGACLLCRLPTLPFVYLSAPSPRPPSPVGKGEIFCFLMQGASPLASPALSRPRHLQSLLLQCPAGGVSGWLPAALAFSLPFCPHPPAPPIPPGRGDFCFILPGAGAPAPLLLNPGGTGLPERASPLASPGLNPGGAGYAFGAQAHKYYQSTILSEMPLSMHIRGKFWGVRGTLSRVPRRILSPKKSG